MKAQYPLRGGMTATIVVPYRTRQYLWETCFRGPYIRRAGNFLRWFRLKDILDEPAVRSGILTELEIMHGRGEDGRHALEIELPSPIGWSRTSPLSAFKEHDLQRFAVDRHSVGMRVRLDRCDLVAPKTAKLSVGFELKKEGRDLVVVMRSIYAGENIGDLTGDITTLRQVVFFDRDHPGED